MPTPQRPQEPQSHPLTEGVVRNAAFTNRPPSPPYLYIPNPSRNNGNESLAMTPSPTSVGIHHLTPEELQIITGGRVQHASDNYKGNWRYEDRRKAQPILDFLYLGPISAARDKEFLMKEGITMVLAIRDVSMSHLRLVAVENASAQLNLQSEYINVTSRNQLIRDFPLLISRINEHLLRVYRRQLQLANATGNVAVDTSTFRRGKVLVFCETGNERSAVVVAAYIMAMYGAEMINAVQYIACQRFCVSFDDNMKYLLRSFEDILEAQRMVSAQAQQEQEHNYHTIAAPPMSSGTGFPAPASKKRGISDITDEDDPDEDSLMDSDRYEDRAVFAPYKQN
jgi:serine/threonine/tyrosine-interacting protein